MTDEELLAAVLHALTLGNGQYWVSGFQAAQVRRVAKQLQGLELDHDVTLLTFDSEDECLFYDARLDLGISQLQAVARQRHAGGDGR